MLKNKLFGSQGLSIRSFTLLAFGLVLAAPAQAQSFDKGRDRTHCTPQYVQDHFQSVTVERVVDGDTIRILTQENRSFPIRMLGIDTPETNFNNQSQGRWAELAKVHLQRLLPRRTPVRLSFDQEICDGYGRLLAHIEKGFLDVNREQIFQGFAVNYCIYPNLARCQDYASAMQLSLDEGRSFLVNSNTAVPYEWRMQRRGGRPNKPVGDVRGHEVHQPPFYTQITVPYRLFFLRAEHVKAPYYFVD